MRYIIREGGKVVGLLRWPQHKGQERVDEDHPDVVTYHANKARRSAKTKTESQATIMLDAAIPKLERERVAFLPDGDPARIAALTAVEKVQALSARALAKIEAATTADEIEAVTL